MASSGSRNRWGAVVMWVVNLPLAVAVVVVMMMAVRPPSPASPSYVPDAADLPSFEPAELANRSGVAWAQAQPVRHRDANQPGWRGLHDNARADWNRRPPFPMPELLQEQEQLPEPEPPTIEDALADLQQTIVVKAFVGPSHVVVALARAPSAEYMLIDADGWTRYLEDVGDSSSRESDLAAVRGMLHNDLHVANVPLTAISIGSHSWTVDYTYRDTTFTLTLGPPRSAGMPEVSTNSVRFGDLADVVAATHGESSRTLRRVTGSGQRETGETGALPTPNGSTEVVPGVWLLTEEEVEQAHARMGEMIEELAPQSVFNHETREYEGIRLTRVPEESFASKRGFIAGDTVISVNGVPVRSVTDVKNYVRNNRSLPQYVVVLDRAGVRQTRTFRVAGGR